MGIDYSTMIYLPNFDYWARQIQITPLASQPLNATPYWNRGKYDAEPIEVIAESGLLVRDHRLVVYVREIEYAVVPVQKDQIYIPADGGMPAVGTFEVTDAYTNGGGETTLVVRKLKTAAPP